MDLDLARNTPVSLKCFCCKLPSHFGNNWPSHHDVRMMTTEELEEVIQQRLVWLDTPQPVQLPDSEAEPEVTSANSVFGYVTLCDTTDTMALWTKGTLLYIATDTFKYKVK